MGHEDRHLGGVAEEGLGDLLRRKNEATWGVEDEVYGHVLVREADGPQDLLRVVNVDVAGDGDPQKAHRLLAVDEGDDPAFPLPFQLGDLSGPGPEEPLLLEVGGEDGEDEEEPKELEKDVHASPPARSFYRASFSPLRPLPGARLRVEGLGDLGGVADEEGPQGNGDQDQEHGHLGHQGVALA